MVVAGAQCYIDIGLKPVADIVIDGKPKSLSGFLAQSQSYLPNHVFGYYSGTSERMEEHFQEHQRLYYKKEALHQEEPNKGLRRLFFARHIHSWGKNNPFMVKINK